MTKKICATVSFDFDTTTAPKFAFGILVVEEGIESEVGMNY